MPDLDGRVFAVMKKDEAARTFTVFLVNRTRKTYSDVTIRTGGWVSFDDELVQTSESVRVLGPLHPRARLQIDQSDLDELDFVIWYRLILKDEDGRETAVRFSIPKYGYLPQQYVEEFGAMVGVMELR